MQAGRLRYLPGGIQEFLEELVGGGDDARGGGEAGGGGDQLNEFGGEVDVGEFEGAADDAAGGELAGRGDHGGAGVGAFLEEVGPFIDKALIVGEGGECDPRQTRW